MAVDLKLFRKNLTYQRTAPVKQLAIDMGAIAKIDKEAEAKQKRFQILLIATIVVAVLLAIVLGAANAPSPFVMMILIVGLAAGVYFGIMLARYSRINVPNYRYGTLSKVLPLLGHDLESNANVNVKLILSKATEKKKRVDTIPHPSRSGWKIDRFQDDWLAAQGQFVDGTQFVLTATELAVAQHGWKRSRSGKMKHKRKEKSKALELSLTLNFPRRKYGAISVLKNEAEEAIQLPDFVQLKSLRVKDNSMYLKVKTPPWVDRLPHSNKTWGSENMHSVQSIEELYKTISMMFLSLYHILNLARTLSKKTTA